MSELTQEMLEKTARILETPQAAVEYRCIVRLTTSFYTDHRGIHKKKSLNIMRRLSTGGWDILDDAVNTDAGDVFARITNIDQLIDGFYEVVIINEKRDYWSGEIDDYDYKLVPYEKR